jgi:hypothetical protein
MDAGQPISALTIGITFFDTGELETDADTFAVCDATGNVIVLQMPVM